MSNQTCNVLLTLSTWMWGADDKKTFSNFFNNFQNGNFHYHIWIHHKKCIQMSTNKPSIGAVVLDLIYSFNFSENGFKFQVVTIQVFSHHVKTFSLSALTSMGLR